MAAARDLAGLTQVQLAEKMAWTQGHISRLENGQYQGFPIEKGYELAKVFGCSLEDLFPAGSVMA